MYLQRLYISLNDKDLHEQIINTESAKQIIKDILSNKYANFTMIDCQGHFLNECEQTIIIEYFYVKKSEAIDRMYIRDIKSKLNQYAILETIQEVEFELL